mgnify:CR=1 FL=1
MSTTIVHNINNCAVKITCEEELLERKIAQTDININRNDLIYRPSESLHIQFLLTMRHDTKLLPRFVFKVSLLMHERASR